MSFHRVYLRLFLLSASLAMILPRTSLAAPDPSDAQSPPSGQPQDAPAQTEKPQGTYPILFTPLAEHGGPLVHIGINGQGGGNFLVDTGSGGNFITEALITKLRLKKYPALSADGKPSKPFGIPISATDITSLTFPTATGSQTFTFPKFTLDVATREQVTIGSSGLVDGFLGTTFLSFWAVSFDFTAHRMDIMYPGSLSPSQVKAMGFGGKDGTVLPLTPCFGNCFSVPVTLSDGRSSRRVDLMVDTGSVATVIPLETARALSLKFSGISALAGGSAGHQVLVRVQLPSLSLGNIQSTSLSVLTTNTPTVQTPVKAKDDRPPVLGMDVLKNYRVLLDYPAKVMYIQPITPAEQLTKPTVQK